MKWPDFVGPTIVAWSTKVLRRLCEGETTNYRAFHVLQYQGASDYIALSQKDVLSGKEYQDVRFRSCRCGSRFDSNHSFCCRALRRRRRHRQTCKRYHIELRKIKHDLDAEYDTFLNTLEYVLDGLVAPKQLEGLLNNPSSALWQQPILNEHLRERLGRSYTVFKNSVNEMNMAVEQCMKQLDLDDQGKTKWTEDTGLKLYWKRAQFSMRKKAFDNVIERLQKHNRHLKRLINRRVEFEPLRKKRKQCSHLQMLGHYTRCVFHALETSFGCTCNGSDKHIAMLGISPRSTCAATESTEHIDF